MKLKYVVGSALLATMFLSACDININTGSNDDSKESKESAQSNDNKKKNDNQTSSNDSSSSSNSDNNSNNNESTSSKEHYAKVWVSVIEDNGGSVDPSNTEINHEDVSGKALNPYNKSASAKFPNGTQILSGTPTAAGQVVYQDNNDGTVTVYNVPSHFQDKGWIEDDYTERESNRILNHPKTVKLQDLSQSQISDWENVISETSGYGEMGTDDSDDNTDDNDSDDSSEKVTRDNVIDKVEDYEGHTLDTSKYNYKEPEQSDNGEWGFSFTDKNGDLAGSYIIDKNGNVTKYDENGDPE
ncbi:hypothetical protein [Staphylococcus caeli]|uniref:Lipoprotein n=1 Tax=Staphylococcus caeli TaxID=2201815 RepID=A0A1D4MJ70_9STAP|nr:hypothetical protein [Staphylococcus caeli]AWM30144.1 hypothetical protein SCC82B_00004 [Staphylococcus caeli]SCS79012.1 lipoprotein [Staphylococcus caeli]SCS98535.1 lipoprotein [Staphylococcus caeli]